MPIAAADGEQVYDPIYKQKVLSAAHGFGWLPNSLLMKIELVMHLVASTLESLWHKNFILLSLSWQTCRFLIVELIIYIISNNLYYYLYYSLNYIIN